MSTYYKQLTQEQRYQIYALKKAGHGQMEIANIVDVHKSTISRELCRKPWSARVPTKASAQVLRLRGGSRRTSASNRRRGS